MGMKKDKEKKADGPEKEKNQDNEENLTPSEAGSTDAEATQEEATRMVLLPAEDVEKLKAQAAEANTNLENWKRERADFVNFRKIVERDEKTLRSNIKIDVIRKYLPVLDDLELALKALPDDAKDKAWFSGIELIYRKLQNILDTEGVTRISAGEFDPTRHEAITFEASPDHESGEVIEIIKQGYMLGDRVLRPAQVRVAQ